MISINRKKILALSWLPRRRLVSALGRAGFRVPHVAESGETGSH
jgi:hypothetical protein